jgi:hypothetical protein
VLWQAPIVRPASSCALGPVRGVSKQSSPSQILNDGFWPGVTHRDLPPAILDVSATLSPQKSFVNVVECSSGLPRQEEKVKKK